MATTEFEIQKFTNQLDPSDSFGQSCAIDGNWAVVGSPSADSSTANSSGSIDIYENAVGQWTHRQKIFSPGPRSSGDFGISVDISGSWIVVGAPRDIGTPTFPRGAAYIYKRSGSTFNFIAKIEPLDAVPDDWFGRDVSIDKLSAATIVIGSYNSDPFKQGAVYVYVRSGDTWNFLQKLLPSQSASDFGRNVDVEGDTIAVADPAEGKGRVYVFGKAGTTFGEAANFLNPKPDIFLNKNLNRFGTGLTINNGVIVAGSSGELGAEIGAAYVFRKIGTVWTHITTFSASVRGYGTSIGKSGKYIIVSNASSSPPGFSIDRVDVFENTGTDIWKKRASLNQSDTPPPKGFGKSVAVSGNIFFVAQEEDLTTDDHIYVYDASQFIEEVPGIQLTGFNDATIANGDNTPSVSDGTIIGTLTDGVSQTVVSETFTITNTGITDLVVDTFVLSHPHTFVNDLFQFVGTPGGTIAPGQSLGFQIVINNTATNGPPPGLYQTQVSFNTNVPSTPVYTFSVQASVAGAGNLQISGNGIVIPAGRLSTSFNDGTRTDTLQGTPVVVTFQAKNLSSNTPINFTGSPIVSLINPVPTNKPLAFEVTQDLPSSLSPNATSNFQITFLGTSPSLFHATVSITSDDPSPPTYTFAIASNITALPSSSSSSTVSGSKMIVKGNNLTIFNGDLSPRTADGTDFGSIQINSGEKENQFTVTNEGTVLVDIGTTSVPAGSGFKISDAFTGSLQPGNSYEFSIVLEDKIVGSKFAIVSIVNSETGIYNFAVQGVVTEESPPPPPGTEKCEGVTVEPRQKIYEQFPAAGRRIAESVAIDGDKALCASAGATPNGIVEIFRFLGKQWDFEANLENASVKLQALGVDKFGSHIDISGDIAVVTHRFFKRNPSIGLAFVFKFNGIQWKLLPPTLLPGGVGNDTPENVQFTSAKTNGEWIALGAVASGAGPAQSGAVFLYKIENDVPIYIQKITPSDAQSGDSFGSNLSLDGDTLVVAAGTDNPTGQGGSDSGNNLGGRGAVYVFTRSGNVWTERAKITNDDEPGVLRRRFGGVDGSNSLVLHGQKLYVGQPAVANVDNSAIYIYEGSGASWSLVQKITESNLNLSEGTSTPNIGNGIVVDSANINLFTNFASDITNCTRVAYFKDETGSGFDTVGVFIISDNNATQEAAPPFEALQETVVEDPTSVLALSDDGKLLVGIPNNEDMAPDAGAMYFYLLEDFEEEAVEGEEEGGSISSTSSSSFLAGALSEVETICEAPYVSDPYCDFTDVYDLASGPGRGGKWYYRQNKPGTPWFDKAENHRGWTVDFNLVLNSIQNISALVDTDKPDGLGIYVNDGSRYETIYFLNQEVFFANANQTFTLDATANRDYRLLGQNNALSLYQRPIANQARFDKVAEVNFNAKATNEANGRQPAVVQDAQGRHHVVWYDDGNRMGQLYYAMEEDAVWTEPELLVSTRYGLQNPDIAVGNNGNIYIAYETLENEATNVGFIYKNNIGWSSSQFIGTGTGHSRRPRIAIDDKGDLHATWEDHRLLHPEIFYNRWTLNDLSWGIDTRVTDTTLGALRPSIAIYRETAYISWTDQLADNRSRIKISSYNASSGKWNSSYNDGDDGLVTGDLFNQADYSHILTSLNGELFITYHDNATGEFEIYHRILDPNFSPLTSVRKITNSFNDSLYPRLAEHKETGNIYVVWEDYRELDPNNDPYSDPYLIRHPSHIFVACYNNLTGTWHSSGQGEFDIRINAFDDRRWSSPAVPTLFSGNLHILYEALMAVSEDEYLKTTQMFYNVKDAIYTLSLESEIFNLFAEAYRDNDLLVSDRELRKEIRFGNFSNTLSSNITFGKMGYYLEDAVEPFEIVPVSSVEYDISDFAVNDAVANDHGDAWLGTACGLIFYFAETGNITVLEDSNVANSNIHHIRFNKNNVMFVLTDSGIFYSTDHVSFVALSIEGATDPKQIAFDNHNRLVIGTTTTIFIVEIDRSFIPTIVATIESLPSSINVIDGDAAGVIWIGTNNGLVRLLNNDTVTFTTKNGLPSNRINDIAIRNTAIRYIATGNGLVKMFGSSFERIGPEKFDIDKFDLYNSNVKSIAWQDPNIVWAGTLSRLNQITVDDRVGSFNTATFNANQYGNFETEFDDLTIYYVLTEDTFDGNCLVEVYINGTRVKHGFKAVLKGPENPGIPLSMIKFKTQLKSTDRVDVIIRNDIKLLTSFEQIEGEKEALGSNVIRVKDVSITGDRVYAVTRGDEHEVKLNDSVTAVPFDRIHLDTTPPSGELTIVEQVFSNTVKVRIDNATDGLTGSGLDKMIISNFTNFTTDGTSAETAVPFTITSNHNIGDSLDNIVDQLIFDSGTGSVIRFFVNNTLWATTSQPAKAYQFDFNSSTWIEKISFGANEYIDEIVLYNNKLVIIVGVDIGFAKLYSYDVADSTFVNPTIISLNGRRGFASVQSDNLLFIGVSPTGSIYSFDGEILTLIVAGVGTNIYALTAFQSTLYAATGETGAIFSVDHINKVAPIIHTDTDDRITSISAFSFSGDKIFAGTASDGKIIRTEVSDIVFDTSFRTVNGTVSAIKQFGNELFAAVGKILYFLTQNGTWAWRHTHSENITDITFDAVNNVVYLISDTKITRVEPIEQEKCIYLKLIDKAGNETILFDGQGNIVPDLTDCITISDLAGFVNENKILELDELGNLLFTLEGDAEFYSGTRIDEEKGIYTSQIFNGTNDFIAWDTINWQITEPTNTEIRIFVRASTLENDIDLKEWQGPFLSDQATGVDISYLEGQFIQFKAELISKIKNISPSLHRVTIKSVTSEAVHFFTTNFVLGSRLTKGILTSQKILPVSADIVFGVNTTNSVDWSDYQEIDENRIFNVAQIGEDMRVGIKFISPARGTLIASEFDEYGPYNTSLFINTIDFNFTNGSGTDNTYQFRVTLYNDFNLEEEVFLAFTQDNIDGFSIDGKAYPVQGQLITAGSTSRILFTVPGSANVDCDTFYFVKVEAFNGSVFERVLDTYAYITGCSASYVDTIDFNFSNTTGSTKNFHFRIRFYEDEERTMLLKTIFSGNDRSGWFTNDESFGEDGVGLVKSEETTMLYRPNLEDFEPNKLFYITIDAFDGSDFILASNSFTFIARDITSLIYCGGYLDVPIVKNFGLMFELENKEFLTLNQ